LRLHFGVKVFETLAAMTNHGGAERAKRFLAYLDRSRNVEFDVSHSVAEIFHVTPANARSFETARLARSHAAFVLLRIHYVVQSSLREMSARRTTKINTTGDRLSGDLLERVLLKLGWNRRPEPTLENLGAIYRAWCQRVPFDNVRKLIHVQARNPGPLPGSTADDFFEAWLRFGTGGTCWSGAGACHALLVSLDFDATRGVATMLVTPDLPPNHGTVRVTFDAANFLVDCSILHGAPLLLNESVETGIEHAAWGVRCRRRDGRLHVAWRPLNRLEGFECRFESFGATREEFEKFHENTRAWSPFNYELALRLNRGNDVVGVAFGHKVSLLHDGSVIRAPISRGERMRFLVEEIGLAEEIVAKLPGDIPTPPPPLHGMSSGNIRDAAPGNNGFRS
jgi:N-hydroxyarylamine O-acetyltransferase